MTILPHKINILNIEHVEHASRIIVTYELLSNTANFDSPGWLYISDGCGYRDICSDDWMCIQPNTQHPLHSDTIKAAGIYYFIWDYYGIGGLSNEDFTSERSFLIQIALQDSGVGWIDPCIEDPNLSPWNGDAVSGDMGTSGNCGNGYLIDVDYRGCLICIEDDICDNTVPGGTFSGDAVIGTIGNQGNCPDGWHIELDQDGCPLCVEDGPNMSGIPPSSGPPFPPPPPKKQPKRPRPPLEENPRRNPVGGPGGVSVGDFGGGGGIDDYENYFGKNAPGFGQLEDIPGVNDIPDAAGSIDRGINISYDIGPTEDTGTDYGPRFGRSAISGHLPTWMTQSTPSEGGAYSIGDGKVVVPDVYLSKGYYGGRAPHINSASSFGFSQRYGRYLLESYGHSPVTSSENEIGVTTRKFKGNDGTINNVITTTNSSSKTAPSNAITNIGSNSYLSFSQATIGSNSILYRSSTILSIPRSKTNEISQETKAIESRNADQGVHTPDGAAPIKIGSANRRATTSSFQRNVSIVDRSPGKLVNYRDIENAKFFPLINNDPNFTNLNKVGISVVPNEGPVGADFYVSCYAVPHVKKDSQTFALSLYIQDSTGKTQKVADTGVQTCKGTPRRIATKVKTANLSPGRAVIYFVIKNAADSIIYRSGQYIVLHPAGQISGSPDYTTRNLGPVQDSRNYIGGMINASTFTSLELPIGGPGSPLKILASVPDGSAGTDLMITLAAQTTSLVGRRKHAIYFYETDDINLSGTLVGSTLIAASTPEDSGPNIFGNPAKVSSVLYHRINMISTTRDQFLITIANRGDQSPSMALIEIGGDLAIISTEIINITDNNDGTHKVKIQTPFYNTEMIMFEAGGNNAISSNVTTYNLTSTIGGVALKTFPINRDSWVGIALKEPATTSLASRTFFFVQI